MQTVPEMIWIGVINSSLQRFGRFTRRSQRQNQQQGYDEPGIFAYFHLARMHLMVMRVNSLRPRGFFSFADRDDLI